MEKTIRLVIVSYCCTSCAFFLGVAARTNPQRCARFPTELPFATAAAARGQPPRCEIRAVGPARLRLGVRRARRPDGSRAPGESAFALAASAPGPVG